MSTRLALDLWTANLALAPDTISGMPCDKFCPPLAFFSVEITALYVRDAYIAGPVTSPAQAISLEMTSIHTAVFLLHIHLILFSISRRLHSFSLLSHFQRIKYSLITRPSHSRCSRIRASEKRRRLRNRQRLAGCLRGHSTPGRKLSAESGRTELFAVGSGNTAAINDAGALGYCGRHSRGEIASRVSVHLLSLCGGSNFPCANCPNGLVRDDDAAVFEDF